MAKIPSHWPKGIKTADEVLGAALEADPEFAAEWERLALARMVAARLIGFRSESGLSQRELAKRLGVSQPRVVELESGEKNPQIETLVKIAAATGIEFAFDVVPVGQEPTFGLQVLQGSISACVRRRVDARRRSLTRAGDPRGPQRGETANYAGSGLHRSSGRRVRLHNWP